MTSLFLIRRCHFSMETCLDVLNRKSVQSVSLRRAKPSDPETGAWARWLTPGEGALGSPLGTPAPGAGTAVGPARNSLGLDS